MKAIKEYPECPFEHHDCFALFGAHQCKCLQNTNFGKRDCPFYKNKFDYETGIESKRMKHAQLHKQEAG